MKPASKKILLGLVAVLAAVQFVRPAKNSAATPGPDDLLAQHAPPAEVRRLLVAACYDCHSDNTRHPWYAEIEPVGWWLAGHVRNGRQALNFSRFGTLAPKAAAHALDDCVDEVNHGEMPPASYRLVHADARLGATEKAELTAWFQGLSDKISAAGGRKIP
jgi:hypothetical protein